MGWFDEQIKERKLSDQDALEDSFLQVASVVLGKKETISLADRAALSGVAVEQILANLHIKADIPDQEGFDTIDDYLEFVLNPHGVMRRNVVLKDKWYEDAFGPMLGFLGEEMTPVALIPGNFFGYTYIDPHTGKKVKVNNKTAKALSEDAYCFYKPLPLKKLGIPDLIIYIRTCVSFQDVFLMIAASVIVSVVGLITPRLNRALTGTILQSGDMNLFASLTVFMVCTVISSKLFNTAYSISMGRVNQKVSLNVEAAVFARMLSLPARFFRDYSSGELSSRASSVSSLCNMLMGFVFSVGLTSLSSILYIHQIFDFAPALVIPSLVITISTLVLSTLASLLQIKISSEQMKLGAKGEGLSYALVSGIQKIKLAGAEKRAYSKWLNHYAKEAEFAYNPPFFLKINRVILLGVQLIGNIVLYYLAIISGISVSTYFAFNTSYGMVAGALNSLASITLSFARARPVLEMAEPILKEVPEVSENRQLVKKLNGGVELNNVYFRYDENSPYVVNDLSLKIRPGEYVAIVGKTGCGKSTLMRLLLGFEKPEKGAVYYDGRDIDTMELKSLRRNIGTVMQNGGLFPGSIFENISICKPDMTMDEAWEAAETADVAQAIREMPMGMQTMISEGQGGISGGQKQRLMIARAIAPKPSILMFDEATSALDNVTQKHIATALDTLKCTRIVIAHRLSTIRNCDRILVLDGGRIIEEGTYDELIAMNGFFKELVERQQLDENEA